MDLIADIKQPEYGNSTVAYPGGGGGGGGGSSRKWVWLYILFYTPSQIYIFFYTTVPNLDETLVK